MACFGAGQGQLSMCAIRTRRLRCMHARGGRHLARVNALSKMLAALTGEWGRSRSSQRRPADPPGRSHTVYVRSGHPRRASYRASRRVQLAPRGNRLATVACPHTQATQRNERQRSRSRWEATNEPTTNGPVELCRDCGSYSCPIGVGPFSSSMPGEDRRRPASRIERLSDSRPRRVRSMGSS